MSAVSASFSFSLTSAPTPAPASPCRAITRHRHGPLFASLSARLDAALIASPVVTSLGPDPAVETLLSPLGLGQAGLAIQGIRVQDGRHLVIVAVPAAIWITPTGKAGALALKRAARGIGRRVLLVPEGAMARDPRLADALMIAACAGLPVAPSDRVALMASLIEEGGSMPLSDAAAIMVRAEDPVAAILALAAGRVVAVDLSRAIGPDSRILDLAGRSWTLGGQR